MVQLQGVTVQTGTRLSYRKTLMTLVAGITEMKYNKKLTYISYQAFMRGEHLKTPKVGSLWFGYEPPI